ncbi:hypothetical protein CGRA01v4_09392 [Colletotrichum graminicola]|nr:hypothetical protein CGRA01v4_09392 [Colletotrichum graminicola]
MVRRSRRPIGALNTVYSTTPPTPIRTSLSLSLPRRTGRRAEGKATTRYVSRFSSDRATLHALASRCGLPCPAILSCCGTKHGRGGREGKGKKKAGLGLPSVE